MKALKEFSSPSNLPPAAIDFYKVSGVRSDISFDVSEFEAAEYLRKHGSPHPSVSRTRQEFAEECDINTIMERYEASGVISHVNRAEPMYLDTTEYPTLQGAMDLFREAASSFNALPAKVRREFDNDPQKFIDFASDPANVSQLREWGLAEPEKVAEPPFKVEVVNPAAPAAPLQDDKKPA